MKNSFKTVKAAKAALIDCLSNNGYFFEEGKLSHISSRCDCGETLGIKWTSYSHNFSVSCSICFSCGVQNFFGSGSQYCKVSF